MQTVNVNRSALLAKIKSNRENHRTIFEKAMVVYRARVIDELDHMIAQAKRGGAIVRAVGLLQPEDHTDDYDNVIAMLEMSVDDQIELTSQECLMYVQDNWGWARSFRSSTMSYAAEAS